MNYDNKKKSVIITASFGRLLAVDRVKMVTDDFYLDVRTDVGALEIVLPVQMTGCNHLKSFKNNGISLQKRPEKFF